MSKSQFSTRTTLAMICPAGAITILVFHVHLLMCWQGIYYKYPWEGQEGAMAQGNVKPNFAQSTLSFNVARILLLVVAVIVGFEMYSIWPVEWAGDCLQVNGRLGAE